MKALLLALALLCGLAPAASGKLLVVYNSQGDAERSRDVDVFLRVLESMKVDYTIAPSSLVLATKASRDSLGSGKYEGAPGLWLTFDAAAFPGFRRGQVPTLDSFTFVPRAPFVPFIFISDRQNSSSFATSATACSTGAGAGTAVSGANLRAYDPRSWAIYNPHTGTGTYYPITANETNVGLVRRLLGFVTVAQATGEDVPSTPMTGRPDSAFVWARMFADPNTGAPWVLPRRRSTTDAAVDTAAPVIFAAANQSGQQGRLSIILTALGFADSVTRGAVLRGASPKKIAPYIEGADKWGSGNAAILPSDSTFFRGTLDSLAALEVPCGVGVDPCSISVASKAYFTRWIANGWFYPIPQQPTNVVPNGNASSTYPADMTGLARMREALSETCTAAGDTSTACLLRWGATIVANAFPQKRVCRAVLGSNLGIWLSASTPAQDSLFSAYASADFFNVVSNARLDPWMSGALYATDGVRVPLRPDLPMGAASPVNIRCYITGSALSTDNSGWGGRHATNGRYDPGTKYQTAQGISVYRIMVDDLVSGSGSGGFTTNALTRVSYYETKWLVNGVRIANRYCWPGNSVGRFVRIDEL